MDGGHSAGEIGGIVAGVVAVLAAIGKGIGWLLDWLARRTDKRALYLDEYRQSLDRAAKDLREGLETRLADLELEVGGLRKVVAVLVPVTVDVTAELHRVHPASLSLARGLAALKQLRKEDLALTPVLAALVAGLDAMGGQDGGSA